MQELIEALRNCACIKNEDHCKICGYRHSTECGRRIAVDAADAIERLTAEIDRKDKALIAWLDKWEQTKGKPMIGSARTEKGKTNDKRHSCVSILDR